VALFAGAWATQPTVTSDANGWRLAFGPPAAVDRPGAVQASRGLTPEQVRQVAGILSESEVRTQQALAELVRSEGGRSHAELRTEIEQIRQASEENFLFQKARWDQLQRDLAESSNLASIGR
jgi:hypothetical protein